MRQTSLGVGTLGERMARRYERVTPLTLVGVGSPVSLDLGRPLTTFWSMEPMEQVLSSIKDPPECQTVSIEN